MQSKGLKERWVDMWEDASFPYTKIREEMFQELCRRYSEKGRCYHTLAHIEYCLNVFDEMRFMVRRQIVVQLAVWFHDAIYVPGRTDNEEKSAEFFKVFAEKLDLSDRLRYVVYHTILATTHKEVDQVYDRDSLMMLDIDLSPLAAPVEVFDRNSAEHREEYGHMSDTAYRARQRSFMSSLLDRPSIYLTENFRERYEDRAKANIERFLSAA